MDYMKLIEKLKKRGSIPGLEAVDGLLDRLGHPEEELPIIHIAGTNGKGSVFACLSSILEEAGYRVGRFVSPSISCYEERFQINGRYITKDELDRFYGMINEAMCKEEEDSNLKPTLFEVETALAFLYFKEKKVDFALIETGMGGMLDATNVIKHPVLTVISSISYDHKAMLGDTLEEIAFQKAGIIKENCPILLSENPPEVSRVIKEQARNKNAYFKEIRTQDYKVTEETAFSNRFRWNNEDYTLNLPGRHQISNAVIALSASEYLLKDMLPAERIKYQKAGLEKAVWPGRLEILKKRPLFYRDGAHNPDGAGKLADFLEKHFTNKKIIYIMGVLKDKEYRKMLEYLMPLARTVFVFRPENERGLCADILADEIRKFGISAVICPDVNEAVRQALAVAKEDDVLVACGSLSFMGEMEEIK